MEWLSLVRTLSAAALALIFAVPAASAAEKSLGVFKTWEAYTFEEDGKTVCVVWGKPEKSEGEYTRRGDVRVFVAHRTWQRPPRVSEISFQAGYPFKNDGEATVTVDGKKFTLFTDTGNLIQYGPVHLLLVKFSIKSGVGKCLSENSKIIFHVPSITSLLNWHKLW